ncbi:hypothetical protein ADK53_36780 [Streptomyces sp. WM6373]|uniref:hypothetical protein n=1 Tax=Streptomyces TaxID=1883 RepID=UPI0006AF7B60|nr:MULTISPECIES: hypothetical protein [unclassified Streptomyces]KOU27661.1 hypothetical protein ADK53_36780 [Streptomyces sp. WM6373]KOU56640.1 hypothetical protein ADK96_37770 [Streptomyces sp. IGB124]KOV13357.1 hypothetical protein ADK90_38195 [Streptomyces sp. XY413]KOV48149.1 hypothetical protein ADK97_02280 [Streptomyces sp. H021]
MRKLAWAARGTAAVAGALLAGALVAPSALAHDDPTPKDTQAQGQADESKRCSVSRDVSSTVVDYSGAGGLFETVFRAATDRQGHAFLNDSRNPGVWINLGLLAGAPQCVSGTAVSVTEEDPGHLYITLLASNGVIRQAVCTTASGTPFTPANLPAACGAGFAPLAYTPVI